MILKPDTCKSCHGWGWGCSGFVPASGSGDNGVLIVAEAAGEHEAQEGMPLVGKAGYYLFQQLARVGIDREGFRCHNVLSCRPPENKLSKMPYELNVIQSCVPNLEATIASHRAVCKEAGKTPVILTLGRIAFKAIMDLSDKAPIMKEDYLCYPHWNEKHKAWVVAADHPSYLMRGYHHLVPVLQFSFKRALEIANTPNFNIEHPKYILDPQPVHFQQWIEGYEAAFAADPDNTFLSYDIETPYKQGADEEKVAKEDDGDYTILRCSFAYKTGDAVSVAWRAEFMPMLERLFRLQAPKVGWNLAYDSPRVRAQMPIFGQELDGMLAWHVLNTSMPKGLGFVTPFYAQNLGMWKHLSATEPAFYNAVDSDAALRNWLGVREDLKTNDLWSVFDRHIIQLNQVLGYMSEKGVLRDEEMRSKAEVTLQTLLDGVEAAMESSVPVEARRLKVFKKTPKSTEGLIPTKGDIKTTQCPACGLRGVKAAHFKSVGKKKLKLGVEENPCVGQKSFKVTVNSDLWALPLPFKVSMAGMMNYQKALRHRAIVDRKEKRITFDATAIERLVKIYPKDPLYPRILSFREYQKLLGTYVGITEADGRIRGGMPIGKDGRIHTLFTHNPSTLRSASQNPNLQNLPRTNASDPEALGNIIRNLILASPGHIFIARDYSGIEAVLVGYFARSPEYIRLAKMDVHSFYTAYCLNALDGRVSSSDLPLLSWSDEKLSAHLAGIKKEFKQDRNNLYKHLVHGGNFMQSPTGAKDKIFAETGIEYPVSTVSKVMNVYFELFPAIRKWHGTVMQQAEKDGYIRNPFGYIHRFNKVYEYEKIYGKWEKSPGPEANKVIAFGPQSTAAGMIKEAMLRLYFNRYEEAGQYLRLLVHDELFSEVPEVMAEAVDKVMAEEMERPVPELALPASYGMGDHLVILTEAKKPHVRWGSM